MKKKGFTLVELLAVIVILAVILTIAVPAVKKTIDNAKKKSAENDALMIKNIAEKYYTSNLDKDEEITGIDLSTDTLSYSGEKPTKGYLYFTEDGIAYGKMYINGYCVEVKSDGTNTSEKVSIEECNITNVSTGNNNDQKDEYPKEGPYIVSFDGLRYENGEIIYYNPVANKKCSKEEAVSTMGTKDGCMKWYAFLDDGSSKLKLILDHNTKDIVAWNSTGSNVNGAITAKEQLKSDITNWNEKVKSTARFITAEEIASITKYPRWSNKTYFLHNNSTNQYQGSAGTNQYSWLFNNTSGCKNFGCDAEQSGTNGYWTDSTYYANTTSAWVVDYFGYLGTGTVNVSNSNGIRPVIEVDKTILSDTKEVTYGSTYGSLPLPTKSRYKFLGWYTTSGVKVDSDTKVEITDDTTLYAQWESVGGYYVAIEAYYAFYVPAFSVDFYIADGTIKKYTITPYSNMRDIVVEENVVKVVVNHENNASITVNRTNYDVKPSGDFKNISNKTYSYNAKGTSFNITQDSSCSIYFAD